MKDIPFLPVKLTVSKKHRMHGWGLKQRLAHLTTPNPTRDGRLQTLEVLVMGAPTQTAPRYA